MHGFYCSRASPVRASDPGRACGARDSDYAFYAWACGARDSDCVLCDDFRSSTPRHSPISSSGGTIPNLDWNIFSLLPVLGLSPDRTGLDPKYLFVPDGVFVSDLQLEFSTSEVHCSGWILRLKPLLNSLV